MNTIKKKILALTIFSPDTYCIHCHGHLRATFLKYTSLAQTLCLFLFYMQRLSHFSGQKNHLGSLLKVKISRTQKDSEAACPLLGSEISKHWSWFSFRASIGHIWKNTTPESMDYRTFYIFKIYIFSAYTLHSIR